MYKMVYEVIKVYPNNANSVQVINALEETEGEINQLEHLLKVAGNHAKCLKLDIRLVSITPV